MDAAHARPPSAGLAPTSSMSTQIELACVTGPEERAMVLAIARRFGAMERSDGVDPQRFSHPNAAYNSRVFLVGDTVVKEVVGWRMKKPGMAEGLAQLADAFQEYGIPTPVSLRADGRAMISEDGKHWVGYRYIPATRYFTGEIDQQRALGGLLAKVHQGLSRFASDNPTALLLTVGIPAKAETLYTDIPSTRSVDEVLRAMASAPDLNEHSQNFRSIVQAEADSLRAVCRYVEGKLAPGSMQENSQLVHAYVHPQNLLVCGEPDAPELTLLDYETIVVANPEFCLGTAALECVRQGAALHGVAQAGQMFDALVAGYAAVSGRTVAANRIAAFAGARAVTNALLNIKNHFLDRNSRGDFNVEKHLRSPGEVSRLLIGSAI